MKLMPFELRPELDPLWPRLKDSERAVVGAWCEIARRMCAAHDKTSELALVIREYAPVVRHISQNTVYVKIGRLRERGPIEGLLNKTAIMRARGRYRDTSLPPGFVSFWKSLCGDHQRGKKLPAWRELMRRLVRGDKIPGYETDWRGIWLKEHPGEMLPTDAAGNPACPYNLIHNSKAACQPKGWCYASLCTLAPSRDAMAGATVGVHAMQNFNPVIPHTRVGLRPMQVITMDDVMLDQYCWYPGEADPRRPVGLGVMDVLTGNIIDFTIVPAIFRADGTVSGLKGFWKRYVWANICCNIGIDAERGLTFLAEHGSAGLTPDEEKALNDILGPRPDGGRWVTVQRSSTSGAPLLKGLFRERGRGRPTHKAMIEAAWNLLHNEMAMLPAPSGRNWDAAPQDVTGWTAEDKAVIEAGAQIIARNGDCREALEILHHGQTHALSYSQLSDATYKVIDAMNHRRDHDIQDWVDCGFARSMVPFAGALVPLDKAIDELAGDDAAMRELVRTRFADKQQMAKMSPAEAWHSFDPKLRKVFDPFTATQILGDELAQQVEVDARRQFTALDEFSGRRLLFSANVRRPDGSVLCLQPGEKVKVWVNPIRTDWALVSRREGEFLGASRYMAPTQFGNPVANGNLGELALARAEQKSRAAEAKGAAIVREAERREKNFRALGKAAAAKEKPVFDHVEAVDVLAITETTGAPVPTPTQEEDEDDGFLARMNRNH